MGFLDDIFSKKKKEEIKVLKDSDFITRSQLCPPKYQGILMNHTETIRKVTREKMNLEPFSKKAMTVSIKFFNKDNKTFYALELARGFDKVITSDSYSHTIAYRIDSRYNVNLSISIYIKNRNDGGVDQAKKFFDMVEKAFMNECKIR